MLAKLNKLPRVFYSLILGKTGDGMVTVCRPMCWPVSSGLPCCVDWA